MEDTMPSPVALRIQGMSCGHCVAAVERALHATPGVTGVSVHVGRADFDIEASENHTTVVAAAVEAIESAGYDAMIDERPVPASEAASGCCCGSARAPDTVNLGRRAQ